MNHYDGQDTRVDSTGFCRVVEHSLEEVPVGGEVGKNGGNYDQNTVEERFPKGSHCTQSVMRGLLS